MKIRVLNASDMESSVDIKDIIEADIDALSIYSKGEAIVPLRANLDTDEKSQSLYMPGFAKSADALGIKIVAVYPDNESKNLPVVPATMILQDAKTGIVNCIMDGTYLTQLRTGAISGAATKYLAREDAKIFTIIGAGGQSLTQIEAVLAVRDIKTVQIIDLDEAKVNALVEKVKKNHPDIEVIAVKEPKEAIAKTDILTLVTTSKRPVFDGNLVHEGMHINSVGSYTPQMQETPPEVLIRADRIFLDTKDGVLNESGDVITPLSEKKVELQKLNHELGELINGDAEGRKSDSEITWFKTTGSAVLDIVSAQKIYELACEKNLGSEIEI